MWIVLVSFLILMVDGFNMQAIGMVAPDIARSWSIDMSAFGAVFSAGLAGFAVGAFGVGVAVRQVGTRLTMALLLVVVGLVTLASAWLVGLYPLILLRFLIGVGLGAAIPVAIAAVADKSPPNMRATLVTVCLTGQPVGAMIGAMLCARFIPMFGWQFVFYLGGILPLALGASVLMLPQYGRDSNDDANPRNHVRLGDIVGARFRTATLLMWLSSFLLAFCVYMVVNWMPAAIREAGFSRAISLTAISVFNFGGLIGAPLGGLLMDRFGPFKVMPILCALAAAAIASMDLAKTSSEAIYVAAFASGMTGVAAAVCLAALAVLLYPPLLRPMGTGWVLGVGRVGAAIGPLLSGWGVAAGLTISSLFYVDAIAAVGVMLCMIALGRLRRGLGGRDELLGSAADPPALVKP